MVNKLIITHTHTGTELTNNDMKRGQETTHIRKQEAGTQDTHERGLTKLPPPGRHVLCRNSTTREGGWAPGDPSGPTQRHTQDWTSEQNRQTEAQVEQGAQEAKADGPWWPWPRPSALPLQPGLSTPQTNIHGAAQGYQEEPSGAKHNKTILKKTLVTVWSYTDTTGWRNHNRLA